MSVINVAWEAPANLSLLKPTHLLDSGRSELAPATMATSDIDAARFAANPHAHSATEILAALAVSPEIGLNDREVRARQAAFGRNVLDTRPPKRALTILIHQGQSSVVALLAAAAGLAAAFGDWQEPMTSRSAFNSVA